MKEEVKRYDHVGDYCGPECGLEESADGDWVRASDYDAILAERDALSRWKQTAEYWYGQYRLVKHGESPAEYPTEGKLDDWHNSYHNP